MKEKDNIIIISGDFLDKGYNIPGVIEFIHKNIHKLKVVIGNHENFVYKYLKGKINKKSISEDLINEYFNSIIILEKDDILKNKFFEIYEHSFAFFIHKNFIITHAPCEKKYLGKISNEALKAKRDFRYTKRKDFESFSEYIHAFDEDTKFLKDESDDFYPLHVFGHVVTKEISKYKNKIAIDTGCASGGKLTSIIIGDDLSISSKFVSARIKTKKEEAILNFFN